MHPAVDAAPRTASPKHTGLLTLLALPWVAIFRPRVAGQMIGDAHWATAILLMLLASVVIGAGSAFGILIFIEIDTQWGYSNRPRPALPFQVVWALDKMLQSGRPLAYLQFCLALSILYSAVLSSAGLVALPRCGRHDPLSTTLRRGLLCSYAASGLLAFGEMAIACLALLLQYRFNLFWELGPLLVGGLLSLLYLNWVVRVADGACPKAEPRGMPICEGCGYDLTARTVGDLCPECARPVEHAIHPQNGRSDTPWVRRGDFRASFWGALVHPSAFYGQMRLRRRLHPARRFAAAVALTLFLGALAALSVLVLSVLAVMGPGPNVRAIALGVFVAACWTVVLCQWAHGLVAGAAVILLRFVCPVPDDRWIGHAACYEWVFAWPLAMFWGTTAVLFAVYNQPFRMLFGFILGLPADIWWLFGGTAALGIVWLYRYVVIARAIRWSNS